MSSARERANRAFSEGRFQEALAQYDQLIKHGGGGDVHLLYSNRSATYLKIGDYENALSDAYQCVKLAPGYVKGHGRVGQALLAKGRVGEARKAFQNGLSLDPGNSVCKDGLAEAEARAAKKPLQKGKRGVGGMLLRRAQSFAIIFLMWVVYKNFSDGNKKGSLLDTAKSIVFGSTGARAELGLDLTFGGGSSLRFRGLERVGAG